MKHRRIIFDALVASMWFPKKAHRDMLHRTCVVAFDGICRSHSAFWCVQAAKH
jgi:hypothetical protein